MKGVSTVWKIGKKVLRVLILLLAAILCFKAVPGAQGSVPCTAPANPSPTMWTSYVDVDDVDVNDKQFAQTTAVAVVQYLPTEESGPVVGLPWSMTACQEQAGMVVFIRKIETETINGGLPGSGAAIMGTLAGAGGGLAGAIYSRRGTAVVYQLVVTMRYGAVLYNEKQWEVATLLRDLQYRFNRGRKKLGEERRKQLIEEGRRLAADKKRAEKK